MTKVLINNDFLSYQQGMKETLRQVIQQNYIGGVPQPERVDPLQPRLLLQDVLPPPEIELISLDFYEAQDQDEDYIAAEVYHEFGIACMNITIQDDQGNLIESGEMEPFPNSLKLWDYLPTVYVPLGTHVIVQVAAMDCLGGVGTRRIGKTMGEE